MTKEQFLWFTIGFYACGFIVIGLRLMGLF